VIYSISLEIVQEGRTLLIVPADNYSSGPASSEMPVFYNPRMEFSRDMSVAVLGNLLSNGASFLDGLAATGAMGIRICREMGEGVVLHLNDRNPLAIKLIERNLSLNEISDATVTQEKLRAILLRNRYDCVDIDPFGTPAYFFPLAVEAVRNHGILSATATDTGTISGIFSAACQRRYGTDASRTPFCHEIGVRNLLGFIAREAARVDCGIEPLISYYADHYIRCFVRIIRGARRSDMSLRKLGYCLFNQDTLDRQYCLERISNSMGPLWIAQTCDRSLLESFHLPADLQFVDRIANYISLLKGESMINRPFLTLDELTRKLKIDPPKMDLFLSKLRESGMAYRTHYGPKTFTTDLSMEEIAEAMRSSQ